MAKKTTAPSPSIYWRLGNTALRSWKAGARAYAGEGLAPLASRRDYFRHLLDNLTLTGRAASIR